MSIETPAREKFRIIREMTERDNNILKISWLCQTAGVSRSGYYAWLAREPKRLQQEEQDRQDFLLWNLHEALAYEAPGCHEHQENTPTYETLRA